MPDVKVSNNTDVPIRARCVGYGSNVHFSVDVPVNASETLTGIYNGERGIFIYHAQNEEILIHGTFRLPFHTGFGGNIEVAIFGDSNNGYGIDYAAIP